MICTFEKIKFMVVLIYRDAKEDIYIGYIGVIHAYISLWLIELALSRQNQQPPTPESTCTIDQMHSRRTLTLAHTFGINRWQMWLGSLNLRVTHRPVQKGGGSTFWICRIFKLYQGLQATRTREITQGNIVEVFLRGYFVG